MLWSVYWVDYWPDDREVILRFPAEDWLFSNPKLFKLLWDTSNPLWLPGGWGLLVMGQGGEDVILTLHLSQVSRLRMCGAAPPPSLRGVHSDSFCRLGCLLLFGTESGWKDQNTELIAKPSFVPSNEFMKLYFTSFISPCGLGGGAGFSLFSLLKALRILLIVSQHTGLLMCAVGHVAPHLCCAVDDRCAQFESHYFIQEDQCLCLHVFKSQIL